MERNGQISLAFGLALFVLTTMVAQAQGGSASQTAAASSKVQALLEQMERQLDELEAVAGGLSQALAAEAATSPKTTSGTTRRTSTGAPQSSTGSSGSAHTGKYYIKGSTHAYTKHELTHIVQQRGKSIPEISDEVLVGFEHADPQAKQAASDLQAAARRLGAAAKKLAAARDPNAERAALGELKLATQTTQQHCKRVTKIDAFTFKMK